ncbi:phosphoribosylaminoimidazolesuccinocarboxamide synthase [Candidatus Bathyarchaeota archaeon]|nr:phosphoribosylaminoimidazolesuccinocarboxamide synthase [Candidatus Bathyarchaeota archaeon]
MNWLEKRFLRSGKVKDIYDAGNGKLLFVYTDRLSSHDVMLADKIPHKGQVLCRLSAYCFANCEDHGVETHMIEVLDSNKMLVKKLFLIPIEVIGRNYLYGSYWKRYQSGEVQLPEGTDPVLAARLTEPVVEFTTKFEAKDKPLTEQEIVSRGWLGTREIVQIKKTTLELNELMLKDAERAGFILADFKLEFGIDEEGKIILADEAETPDSSRFWDASKYQPNKVQESFDKQIVRDYLEKVKGWDKNQPTPGTKLTKPILPEEIIRKTSQRYIQAYERLTRRRF